jgi:predicted metal-dependent peptidase
MKRHLKERNQKKRNEQINENNRAFHNNGVHKLPPFGFPLSCVKIETRLSDGDKNEHLDTMQLTF